MNSAPPVYVINLDRSADRMRETAAALEKAGIAFLRVTAVDGSDCGPGAARYDPAVNARSYLAPLSAAEAGCIHSHRKAWRQFLESGQPVGIFLEDDARPLATGATIAEFAGSACTATTPVLCKLNLPRAHGRGKHTTSRPLVPPVSTCAYAANRYAAEALLAFTEQFHEPIDIAMQRWWDHRVRILVAQPPLFREEREGGPASTIRPHREPPAEGRLLREIRRPIFQARRLVRAAREALLRGRP